jgi:5'(3')-deoxyribonucleotidase
MDGVLANFDKEYKKYDPNKEDRKKFRSSVLDHHIFEKLDFMPDTQELLDYVAQLQNVHIEILTSMGTNDPFQAFEAKKQKLKWLNDHNISYKANFVHSKQEKSNYAGSTSILIDDSVGCIDPYIAAGGHGILHKNAAETIQQLKSILMHIHVIGALNRE